jgi:hypothetical protein
MRFGAMLTLALVACGGDGGGTDGVDSDDFARACDESSSGDCVLFTGGDWEAQDVVDACSVAPVASCPTASSVGTCTIEGGTGFETVTTFYNGFWNGSQAAQSCQGQGGSFQEP